MNDRRGDVIIGTGVDGTTTPIEGLTRYGLTEEDIINALSDGKPTTVTLHDDGPDFKDFRQHFEVQPTDQPAESDQEPVAEIDLDAGEQVFGISFPASMLPLAFNYGYWESEPILDPDGDPDAALVRVWLYPPNQPGDPMISDESSPEANTPQETEGAN